MRKIVNNRAYYLFFFLVLIGCASIPASENKKATTITATRFDTLVHTSESIINGTNYTRFALTRFSPQLVATRPDQNDSAVVFSIACAFTQLENNEIDGFFMRDGQVLHVGTNKTLGGLLVLHRNSQSPIRHIEIRKRQEFELLSDSSIARFSADSVSCCQQIQLIRDGLALRFGKDKALFQRRALVVFPDGKVEVIESRQAILLQKFADDLQALGASNALYTDMGGWDEGWYRATKQSSPKVIGLNRGQTNRQSNWLIFTD